MPDKPTKTEVIERIKAQLAIYTTAGFRLFPCRGKRPKERGWQTNKYTLDPLANHVAYGGTVAVSFFPGQLAIDDDPRRYPEGRNVLQEFADAVGLELGACPTVDTPSDGSHVYVSLPKGLSLRHRFDAKWPGLEFKTTGRYVIAPPSVHPEKGIAWTWSAEHPALRADTLIAAPQAMIDELRKPERAAKTDEDAEGVWTCAQLEEILNVLPVEEFRDHDRWFAAMCAAHSATAGEGSAEFVAWSTGDPMYADHEEKIRARWESLS